MFFFTRTHHYFLACTQEEHPEHPEHAFVYADSGCSGYTEQNNVYPEQRPMAKPLREIMPETTAFIDACRDAFGKDMIDAVIKAGMEGQPTFYAAENGQRVGTPIPEPRISIGGAQLVFATPCDGCAWLQVKIISPDGKRQSKHCRKFKTIAERKCADWSVR